MCCLPEIILYEYPEDKLGHALSNSWGRKIFVLNLDSKTKDKGYDFQNPAITNLMCCEFILFEL